MRNALFRRLLVVVLALAPLLAIAGPTMYTGEAPVNSQSDDERAAALKTALANVVIERTGDNGVLARADVAGAVAQAERYVLQYQYRANPGGTTPLVLVAQFDGAAVDAMLRRLGFGGAEERAAATEAPSEATVWIGGIRDADDYARVVGYLTRSNFVRGVQPLAAHGDGMLVHLSLATGLARFADALAIERTLGADPATHVDGADAVFVLAH